MSNVTTSRGRGRAKSTGIAAGPGRNAPLAAVEDLEGGYAVPKDTVNLNTASEYAQPMVDHRDHKKQKSKAKSREKVERQRQIADLSETETDSSSDERPPSSRKGGASKRPRKKRVAIPVATPQVPVLPPTPIGAKPVVVEPGLTPPGGKPAPEVEEKQARADLSPDKDPTTEPGTDPPCTAKGSGRGRGHRKKGPDQPTATTGCNKRKSSETAAIRPSKRAKKVDGSDVPNSKGPQKRKLDPIIETVGEPAAKKTPTKPLEAMSSQEELLCSRVMKDMLRKKISWPFRKPVDAEGLGLTDYYEKIKQPMDLSTIKNKLDEKKYSSLLEFEQDFDLMISNCLSYNDASDEVVELATQLKAVFVQRMSDIKKLSDSVVQFSQNPTIVDETNDSKKKSKDTLTVNKANEDDAIMTQTYDKIDKISQVKKTPRFTKPREADVILNVEEIIPTPRRDKEDSQLSQGGSQTQNIQNGFVPLDGVLAQEKRGEGLEEVDPHQLVEQDQDLEEIEFSDDETPMKRMEPRGGGLEEVDPHQLVEQFQDQDLEEIEGAKGKRPPPTTMGRRNRSRQRSQDSQLSQCGIRAVSQGSSPRTGTQRGITQLKNGPLAVASNAATSHARMGTSVKLSLSQPGTQDSLMAKEFRPSHLDELFSQNSNYQDDPLEAVSEPSKQASGVSGLADVDPKKKKSSATSTKLSKAKSARLSAKRAETSSLAEKPNSLKDIYDSEKILVKMSNDTSIPLENRLYDALMSIPFDIKKCTTKPLGEWLEYLELTIAGDPSIVLSTYLGAIASQSNGAMVEVNAANGHVSANNLYLLSIGEKGINKSGARDKVIEQLLKIEEEIVAGYRKDHEMHLASSKAAERTPSKDSSLKTPTKDSSMKNVSEGDNEGTPSKDKPFDERKASFILQSGTTEGMMSSMMSSVHNDFVAEYDEGSIFLKMVWNKDGDSTTFASRLQSLYNSKQTKISNVRGGDKMLKNATLQILAAVQPEIFLDSYIKDPRDAGGTIDRMIFSVCKPVDITLREQDNNVQKMKNVDYPVKRMLETAKEIHPTRNFKWPFSDRAKELVYQINESMANDAKEDKTGAVRPMNSKGLDKLCRLSMDLAIIRVCEDFICRQDEAGDLDVEFDEGNKVIIVEDVVRSAHLLQHSNGVFWVFRQAAREGSASSMKENPGAGFTADLHDWKKHLIDTQDKHKHFEKVIGIYEFKKEDDEDNADIVLLKDVVGDRKLYVRGSSKSGVSDKAACLHYFRVLEFNGLGTVLFGEKSDEGMVDIPKNDYNKFRFKIYTNEDDMPVNGANLIQYIMMANPDFQPFE